MVNRVYQIIHKCNRLRTLHSTLQEEFSQADGENKIIQTCPFSPPQPKQQQKVLLRQYANAFRWYAQRTTLRGLNGLSLKFSIFHSEQVCQLNRNLLNILQQSHLALNSCSFNPDVRAINAYNQ